MNNDLVRMYFGRKEIYVGTLEECIEYCKETGIDLHRCTFVKFEYKPESDDAL